MFTLLRNWKWILIMVGAFFIAVAPQLIFWKINGGHFFIDTYGQEKLYLNNSQFFDGLFSFRKGWFIYTPLMLLIIPGIYYLIKNKSVFGNALLIYSVIAIYVIFSWWCWWYGSCFGCRPIIESYALFSLPLAECLFRLNKKARIIIFSLIPFFIFLNLFQTYQFKIGLINGECMTFPAYKAVFLKTKTPVNMDELMKVPDSEYAYRGLDERTGDIAEYPFLPELWRKKISLKASNGKYVSAILNDGGHVFANRDEAHEWETFTLIMFNFNQCFIISHEKKYTSSDLLNNGSLIANRGKGSYWELFTMITLGNQKVIIKNIQSDFIGYDSLTLKLYAEGQEMKDDNIFIIEDK